MKSYALVLFTLLLSACVPVATPTLDPVSKNYYSLDTRTGIPEVDEVLAAVESGDPQMLRDLFRFTTIACMTVNALGGPPSCREGEAEGTLVEVLPSLGSEGSFLRKDEIDNWPGLDISALYAVYRVSENAYSEEYFPKGDYGIFLIGGENTPGVILQVEPDGIVRLDYVFDESSFPVILQRDASEIILGPESR